MIVPAASLRHRTNEQGRILQELRAEAEQLSQLHRDLSQPALDTGASRGPVSGSRDGRLQAATGRSRDSPAPENVDPRETVSSLMHERKQLMDWGENLYREVARLEKEKASVLQAIEQERAAKSSLEASNDQLAQQCMQMEQALRGGHAPNGGSWRSLAETENAELRKQLAAYAMEIDTLRRDKEQVLGELEDVQEQTQRATMERDSYLMSVEELEKTQQEMENKYERLNSLLEVEAEKKRAFQSRLEESRAELAVVGSSLKLAQDENEKHKQKVTRLEGQIADRKRDLRILAESISNLKRLYMQIQNAFAQQTREYEAFVQEVRGHQGNATRAMRSCETDLAQLDGLVDHLKQDLSVLRDDFAHSQRHMNDRLARDQAGVAQQERELDQDQRDWQMEKRQLEVEIEKRTDIIRKLRTNFSRAGARRRLRPKDTNFVPELQAAQQGAVLWKTSHGGANKRMQRFVMVSRELYMKWGPNTDRNRTRKLLDLQEVIRIEYGHTARACVLDANLQPWLCFTLYNAKRSFDFDCDDERTCRNFVLSLSRLCHWAEGAFQSRPQFEIRKALIKLDEKCIREQTTRGRLLMDAIRVTASQRGLEAAPKASRARPQSMLASAVDIGMGVSLGDRDGGRGRPPEPPVSIHQA
mmetsp:Transcript_40769/g.97881  ORF Transcript_40769/g.97881 Transcript_40769/m.97881 type:complete len:644 (+) Transcript_40769:7-1938(+)